MGRGSRTVATAAAALAIAVLAVPLAGANGPMGGTEYLNASLPPGGETIADRAEMPDSTTSGTVTVSAKSVDDKFFDNLIAALSSKPTAGARVVTCAIVYGGLLNMSNETNDNVTLRDDTLQNLFLHVCLQLALSLSQPSGQAPRAGETATAKCGMKAASVPVKITRSGSGYQAVLNGQSSTPKRLPFRASCTRKGKKMTIVVRARSRKGKLARAIGRSLGVGLLSESSSSGKLRIGLGVR